jgi:hypothetical protein
MCDPLSASIAIGVGSAAAGGMQAVGKHQAQQAAVARSNAIAQQQYQRDLQIAAARDREKGRVHQAELKADTAAKNAYYASRSVTQTEATRALASSNQKLTEKRTGAGFDAQTKLANAIQAQGQVLASGKAGQSFVLQAMDAQRQLGFEQAQINQTLYDAAMAAGVEREGILLDQHSADVAAWNNLPAAPLSPEASFLPVKPIKAQGPSGLALAGALMGSAVDGASAGIGTYKTLE